MQVWSWGHVQVCLQQVAWQYLVSSPLVVLPAGSQQDERKQTPARPSTRTMATPDLPPGFGASTVHSTAKAHSVRSTRRSSSSQFGVARPSVPTLSLRALQGSSAHQQGPVSQQADEAVPASSVDQSLLHTGASASGLSRPQRTPTSDPGRGPLVGAPDRPPGFTALPAPQSQGSNHLWYPQPPSSPSHMSTQMQHNRPQSHQASLSHAGWHWGLSCNTWKQEAISCNLPLDLALAVHDQDCVQSVVSAYQCKRRIACGLLEAQASSTCTVSVHSGYKPTEHKLRCTLGQSLSCAGYNNTQLQGCTQHSPSCKRVKCVWQRYPQCISFASSIR